MVAGQALGELWAGEIVQYRSGIAGDGDAIQVQAIFLLRMWVIAQIFPDPSTNDPRLVKRDMTPTVPLVTEPCLPPAPSLRVWSSLPRAPSTLPAQAGFVA